MICTPSCTGVLISNSARRHSNSHSTRVESCAVAKDAIKDHDNAKWGDKLQARGSYYSLGLSALPIKRIGGSLRFIAWVLEPLKKLVRQLLLWQNHHFYVKWELNGVRRLVQ